MIREVSREYNAVGIVNNESNVSYFLTIKNEFIEYNKNSFGDKSEKEACVY